MELHAKRLPNAALRRLICAFVFVTIGFAVVPKATAGFIEVGASGNYRRSNIDTDAYDESRSLTGSLSYYFNEATALELSYTDGQSKRSIGENSPNSRLTHVFYKMFGLDFIYTVGSRESRFRPYIKAGIGYMLLKRYVDQTKLNGVYNNPDIREEPSAFVPTAGAGFKLSLTDQLSLKVGVDAWTSRPLGSKSMDFDYTARAGLSWLF